MSIEIMWSIGPDEAEDIFQWNIYRGHTSTFGWDLFDDSWDMSDENQLEIMDDLREAGVFGEPPTELLDQKSAPTRSYRDLTTTINQVYYYWITAIDHQGKESDPCSGVMPLQITDMGKTKYIQFETTSMEGFPDEDGILGYVAGSEDEVVTLDNCDDYTKFITDSAVTGSIVITQELSDRKEGTGSLNVELYRYPKRLYSESGMTDIAIGSSTAYMNRCQTFKPTETFDCYAIGLKLKRVGTPSDLLRVSIYSDNAGAPGVQLDWTDVYFNAGILANWFGDINTSYGTGIKEYIYVPMASHPTLTAGSTYWIVLTQSLNASNYYVTKRSGTNIFGDVDEHSWYGANLAALTSQPTYDMNFRACVTGDALNKYIYATFGAAYLSDKTSMCSWMKATRNGGFLSHAFGEAAIGEQLFPLTIAAADTWEFQISDISGVAAAGKNAVTRAGWKITNMDQDVLLRLDYLIMTSGVPSLAFSYNGEIVSLYPIPPITDPRLRSVFYEDFPALAGAASPIQCTYPWNYIGALPVMVAGRNGVVRFAGDGATAPAATPSTQTTGLPYAASLDPVIAVCQAQYGAAAGTRRFGLTGATLTSDPANGIYVRHANAGNYIFVCRSGGAESILDSLIAAANGVFHELKMIISPNLVTCYVDNIKKGTINSNIPSVDLFFSIGYGNATAGNGSDLDYVYISQKRQ